MDGGEGMDVMGYNYMLLGEGGRIDLLIFGAEGGVLFSGVGGFKLRDR